VSPAEGYTSFYTPPNSGLAKWRSKMDWVWKCQGEWDDEEEEEEEEEE